MRIGFFHRPFWLLLLVLFCGWWGVRSALAFLPDTRGTSLRTHDPDTHYFVEAWQENPRFQDTFKWWSGPWGQKYRPFYRPIPSLLFWTEYKLFGISGTFEFLRVLLLSHFLALLFLWRFLVDLLGERDGTLAACLWGACVGDYFIWMSPSGALHNWKDSVESWHALAFTACVWAFLRFLKTNARRWQIAALFLFWLALCVKEMAYMAPFVMLLLCWHEKKLRETWQAVLPFCALAGAMFFFRLWALQGMGFRMQGNAAWKFRVLNDNLGGGFTRIVNGDCLMLSLIVFLLGVWFLNQWQQKPKNERRYKFPPALLLMGLAVGLVVYTSGKTDLTVEDTLSRFLTPDEWVVLPLLASMLFFWWRCWHNQNRHQIFGALFALTVYAPLASGPNTTHIYYFPSVGWSIWLAYGVLDVFSVARRYFANQVVIEKQSKGAT